MHILCSTDVGKSCGFETPLKSGTWRQKFHFRVNCAFKTDKRSPVSLCFYGNIKLLLTPGHNFPPIPLLTIQKYTADNLHRTISRRHFKLKFHLKAQDQHQNSH